MYTAKIFKNGMSQAVRLPKECRFDEKEVYVRKIGSVVLLIPKHDLWKSAWESLSMFTEDFMEERNQPIVQKREEF
jgi:antitoxin VapB